MLPDYIKNGQLYKELKEVNVDDLEDSFVEHVPEQYVFFPSQLQSEEEIKQFINVIKYWSVDPEHVPIFFFHALLDCRWSQIKEDLDSFDPEIDVMYRNQTGLAGRGLLDYAIKVQHLDLIYFLKVTMNVIVIFSWELYKFAIKHNALKSFIYLETVIYHRDQPILDNSIYECCCANDCIDILNHIFCERSMECNFHESFKAGILRNSFRCVEFLLKKGVTFDRTILLTICKFSNDEMLALFLSFQHLFQSNSPLHTELNTLIVASICSGKVCNAEYFLRNFDNISWNTSFDGLNAAYNSIRMNELNLLELILIYGFPYNEETIAYAAKMGNLEAMQLLRSYGCPWNEECMREAALHKKEECFMYAFENGCPRPKICVF